MLREICRHCAERFTHNDLQIEVAGGAFTRLCGLLFREPCDARVSRINPGPNEPPKAALCLGSYEPKHQNPDREGPALPRRTAALISQSTWKLGKALGHELPTRSHRASYAATSSKNRVNFSSSRAGTEDGFISGNLLKNDN